MRFIQGIGYIDDNTYITNQAGRVQNAVSTDSTDFDKLLSAETDKLDEQEQTCNLDSVFQEASEKYNISYDLLKAIAYNESGFRADATSSAGAMGIMQLMPATAKSLGVEDAYDPYQNIMGGAKLLRTLSDMYDGNQSLMIAAYNAGSGNVAKYGGIPPFKETQNYVAKVLATLQSGVDAPETTVAAAGNAQTSQSSSNNVSRSGSSSDTTGMSYADYLLGKYGLTTGGSTSSLANAFSYSEYELLMSYFDTMMNIIASIGDTDSENSNGTEDDSLSDLFRLGTIQNTLGTTGISENGSILGSMLYNRSNLNL